MLVSNSVCDNTNADYLALMYTHYILLLADSPLSKSMQKPRRVFSTFKRKLEQTPFSVIASSYSALSNTLLQQLTGEGTGSITGPFLEDFKNTPIMKEYLEFFKTGRDDILAYIVSFLTFIKKAEIDDPTLEATAFRGWRDVEDRLANLSLDRESLLDLKAILRALLPQQERVYNTTRFSSGSTHLGGRAVSQKLDHFRYNRLIDRAFYRGYSASEAIGFTPEVLPDTEEWYQARFEGNLTEAESDMLYVFKTFGSYRTICREEPTVAYHQQCLADEMTIVMNRGPMRYCVDLRDQQLSRDAAIAGSCTRETDTLDLTSASDSVSLALVKAVFPPYLLRKMLATRARKVVFNPQSGPRQEFSVHKFAPMGSAVCFPTQCIIYLGVVLREYLRWDGHVDVRSMTTKSLTVYIQSLRTDQGLYNKTLVRPRVYGDDIICDSRVTGSIIAALVELGFVVNVAKSFRSSQAVRESCGVYAFDGNDITPFVWKIPHFTSVLPMKCVVGLIDMCNRAGDKHLYHLHRGLVRTLLSVQIDGLDQRRWPCNPIMFTDSRDKFGIYSTNPRNTHLYKRVPDGGGVGSFKDYQRDEYLCLKPRVRRNGRDMRDKRMKLEYHRWVVSSARCDDLTGNTASYHRAVEAVAPQVGWTPLY